MMWLRAARTGRSPCMLLIHGKSPPTASLFIPGSTPYPFPRNRLAAQGVVPVLLQSDSGAPSASAMCLVTPDGQRTMRTCLGASLELQSAAQVPNR